MASPLIRLPCSYTSAQLQLADTSVIHENDKTMINDKTGEELAQQLGIPVKRLTDRNYKHPLTGNRAQRRKKEKDIRRLKKKLASKMKGRETHGKRPASHQ